MLGERRVDRIKANGFYEDISIPTYYLQKGFYNRKNNYFS